MTNEQAAIEDIERRRCKAIGACDLKALGEVLADDYIHVFGTGDFSDREGYFKYITDTPREPERGPLTIRFYGDIAVINGDLINRIHDKAGTRVVNTYVTQVAHKRDGRWQFVSCQLTPKRKPGT